ncbi:hypothetical protein ACSXCO_14820 (plasmid) [Clostridium perfringens]|uniref:hypothetical protein n=2 Tax=Clostridium perfringens TaxID=1502 RepID=UPI00103DED35|nr:hypothetical protein [Clostridium perfringens]TBX13456.1 hypothetical protein BFS07_14595 [Clostridium perfringens]TBX18881.1 hypothetical protein BFS06_16755 [Clostridium perfringens]HAT4126577.1 hypothetical protein [Clostridium perfringens]
MINYFKLKYLIMEDFYESLLGFKDFTIEQVADNCMLDYDSEDELHNLIKYTTLVTRVATHENRSLKNFKEEIEEINKLYSKKKILECLSEDELEDLKHDINLINSFL